MLDLHTHVLPKVDDGAKSVEISIEMLRDSYSQGVRICAATPHCVIHRQSDIDMFLETREEGYKKLLKATEGMEDVPRLLLGAEVYLDNDLNSYEGLSRLCLSDTDYIMLEFPIDKANPHWADWLYSLNRSGFKILVAHVDRYPEWEKMMRDFKGLDIAYQVNASRFTEFGSGKLVKRLMAQGHRYIISSDMHNMTSRRCNMEKAFGKAKKKYPDMAEALFCKNAERVLGL